MKSILVVEDDPIQKAMFHDRLQDHYYLDVTSSLSDAMVRMDSYKYDLVLMDVNLPSSNTIHAVSNLMAEFVKGQNIVFMSISDKANDHPDFGEDAIFISKLDLFQSDETLVIIEALLQYEE